MISDSERREVAQRLRDRLKTDGIGGLTSGEFGNAVYFSVMHGHRGGYGEAGAFLANLIEPSYKPDAEYEAWYNGLSHFGDERGGPSTIHELIEEIVWAALTVDLGPNGNTDSTGVDEGRVYTDKLFAEWEREALRLSGGCDRDALLRLARYMDKDVAETEAHFSNVISTKSVSDYARRIREACGEGER